MINCCAFSGFNSLFAVGGARGEACGGALSSLVAVALLSLLFCCCCFYLVVRLAEIPRMLVSALR